MNRRSFLASILAAAAAPAIVRADSLMRIVPMETTVLSGSALHPDTQQLASEMLAQMEADAAFDAALQIREWSAMDISSGLLITRWDVTAENAAGLWSQHGVDMQLPGAPTVEDRAMVRGMLAGVLRREGLNPTRDKLILPQGARFL